MKIVYCLAAALVLLSGCGIMNGLTGVEKDPQGNVITKPNPPINSIWGLLEIAGPWGIGIAALGRWGTVEYRHRQLIAAGKKDDDRDGNEDPPAPIKTA